MYFQVVVNPYVSIIFLSYFVVVSVGANSICISMILHLPIFSNTAVVVKRKKNNQNPGRSNP